MRLGSGRFWVLGLEQSAQVCLSTFWGWKKLGCWALGSRASGCLGGFQGFGLLSGQWAHMPRPPAAKDTNSRRGRLQRAFASLAKKAPQRSEIVEGLGDALRSLLASGSSSLHLQSPTRLRRVAEVALDPLSPAGPTAKRGEGVPPALRCNCHLGNCRSESL